MFNITIDLAHKKMKSYSIKYEAMKLQELSDQALMIEFTSARYIYLESTRNASISDLQSISNFSNARDHLKRIKKELQRRRLQVSGGYAAKNI